MTSPVGFSQPTVGVVVGRSAASMVRVGLDEPSNRTTLELAEGRTMEGCIVPPPVAPECISISTTAAVEPAGRVAWQLLPITAPQTGTLKIFKPLFRIA